MTASVVFLFAPVLAWVIALLATRLVLAAGVTDAPDGQRKAHREPVPASGGLGAALGATAAVALVLMLTPLPITGTAVGEGASAAALVFALGGFGLLLGLADDVWHLGARLKFLAVALACVLFAAFVARATALPLTADIALRAGMIGGILGTALWIFTVANAVNFTDGANGLSMGASALGLGFIAVLSLFEGMPLNALVALSTAGGLVGFLWWNFPSGRIFAGDAGALFAGLVIGGCGAVAAAGGVPVWAVALCFLPQLADVLLTLAWRLGQKRPLLAAHRDHMFQVGLRAGVSHGRIAVLYWVLTIQCGLCAVAGALIAPWAALLALAVNATISVQIFRKVRAFAAAHGHDTP